MYLLSGRGIMCNASKIVSHVDRMICYEVNLPDALILFDRKAIVTGPLETYASRDFQFVTHMKGLGIIQFNDAQ